jgi:Flp pilus assembly protein TadG
MVLENSWNAFRARAKQFVRARRGNVAMIVALSLVPITIAAGVGLDLSRALMVRARLAEALDAAGLAVGGTQNLTNDQITALARAYFKANYTADPSFGTPADVVVTPGTGNVTLSTSVQMPTTLMRAVSLLPGAGHGMDSITVGYSSKVVWGQTKLWVSLVLDNTGSMCEPDSSPCPNDTSTSIKINALKSASHSLLTTLQNASANPGDVMVSIVPFAKDVNVGTSNVNATWIDWTDWETAPPSSDTPSTSVGPGSSCPWASGGTYNKCLSQPGGTIGSNGVTMSTVSTVPSTGTYAGYICPGSIRSSSTGQTGHYYNGCWTSTPTNTLSTVKTTTQPTKDKQTCSQTGSGTITCVEQSGYPQNNGSSSTSTSTYTTSGYTGDSTVNSSSTTNVNSSDGSKSCTGWGSTQKCTWTRTITQNQNAITTTNTGAGPYNHTWVLNSHSTWRGCIMDRTQSDDVNDATPGTKFPAENSDSCPPATVFPMVSPRPATATDMSAMFTNLGTAIDSMVANGGTNQTIGLAHGMQTLVGGLPYSAPTLPANTTRYIILLSDGLNTMDRWYGTGSSQSSSVDNRMSAACTNAKSQGFVIYTIFLDLNGTQGNSSVLQSCATDTSKYFDLTTAGSVITTFNNIAQQITQLRVAQ